MKTQNAPSAKAQPWHVVGTLSPQIRERIPKCSHNSMTAHDGDPGHAWECTDCGYIYGLSADTHDGTAERVIADVAGLEHAERICVAVNSHADLVTALKCCLAQLEICVDSEEFDCMAEARAALVSAKAIRS